MKVKKFKSGKGDLMLDINEGRIGEFENVHIGGSLRDGEIDTKTQRQEEAQRILKHAAILCVRRR